MSMDFIGLSVGMGYTDKTVRNMIDNINARKFIFIGDSYGELKNQNTWIDVLISKLNLSSNDYVRHTQGSTGFKNPNATSGYTFINLLENAFNSIDDLTDFTDIIVCGGANDILYTTAEIDLAISQFITYAKQVKPDIRINIGMIGFCIEGDRKAGFGNVLNAYKNCIKYGGTYLEGVEGISHNYSYFTGKTYDTVHPNQNGSTALGNGIYECLTRGFVSVFRNWEECANSYGVDNLLYAKQEGNICRFKLTKPLKVTPEASYRCNGNMVNITANVNFSSSIFGGVNNSSIVNVPIIIASTNGDNIVCGGGVIFDTEIVNDTIRNRINICPILFDTNDGGYKAIDISTYPELYILPFEITKNITDC